MSAAGALIPLAPEDAPHFAWTEDPPVKKIVAALEAARAGSARFVGGCVRDSLIGERPKDVDIATTLKPQAVMKALKKAGLGAAPTGLDHGTVTGVADRVGVEITTLRADVATDGRRATVAFTEDWKVDAERRDFRLNAIYLTTDKKLYDPVGGVEDAKAGRVRFIGAPEDRIREDYLRILRFFRFSARFSDRFDAEGLAACARLKEGIKRLSAERVGDEFSKILALPRAAAAVEAMAQASVLAQVWPSEPDIRTLAALKRLDPSAPAPVGLAALWGRRGEGVDAALRLSNANAARRRNALAAAGLIEKGMDERAARAVLYRTGAEAWRDGLMLARARDADPEHGWEGLATLVERAPPPAFPFTGKHVIAAGVARGPAVSRILKAVENAWITEDFPPRERLDEILREKVAAG